MSCSTDPGREEASNVRKIAVEEGLRIGFPGRDTAFHDGVEIGMLATLMALGSTEFAREVSSANIEQARVLGQRLGYHLDGLDTAGDGVCKVTFRNRTRRPKLRLVQSGG